MVDRLPGPKPRCQISGPQKRRLHPRRRKCVGTRRAGPLHYPPSSPSWREGITYTADPFLRLIDLGDSASKNEVLWVWPVQKSYENVSANDRREPTRDLTIRSALISLPSIVLIVAQKSSGWTTGGGRENEGMCGEAGGGVEHGLSNRSGVENVGNRSGVSAHSQLVCRMYKD
jgi:hypothetical protein